MTQIARVTQGLTEQQRRFVRALVDSGQPKAAASIAGYAFPDVDAGRLQALPHVQQAIRDAMWMQLQTEDAPAARRVLRDIMEDTDAPRPIRVECAKTLLNRGGFVEPKAQAAANGMLRSPSEMTGDELRQAIEKMHSEMAMRADAAKLIDGVSVPVPEEGDSKPLDILG